MKNTIDSNKIKHYFAASNGYGGFINYFATVFAPELYEHIYILKGGPGTGKSSFIKNIISDLSGNDLNIEAIHCSSDPDSLDGVIIMREETKVAIIDGTLPHSSDPKYPGSIDTIINLGESWNDVLLKDNRELIKDLTFLKSKHYNNAYDYLSVGGKCTDIVDREMQDLSIDPDILGEDLFSIKNEGKPAKIDIRLVNSFSHKGFFGFGSYGTDDLKRINILGIYGFEYFILNNIYERLGNSGHELIIFPSPLDSKKLDAIYDKNEKLLITTENKGCGEKCTVIDTARLLDTVKLSRIRTKLESLYKERELMLWCATDEFKNAIEKHFELEKIYTASMDFTKTKKKYEKTLKEIKDIFDIK